MPEKKPRVLTCQACHGHGGRVEPVLDYGEGPWEPCGWCDNTGEISPENRGLWLTWKRSEKRKRQLKAAP